MTKEAKREYDRQYYASYSKKQKLRKQKLQNIRRRFLSKQVYDYLLNHPCVDCGEFDPVVLEFDHIRGKKETTISDAVKRGWAFERIMKEIKKCVVRCANCHRRKTAKQLKWFRVT